MARHVYVYANSLVVCWTVAQCVCVKTIFILIGKNATVAKTCSKYEFLSPLTPSSHTLTHSLSCKQFAGYSVTMEGHQKKPTVLSACVPQDILDSFVRWISMNVKKCRA